MIHFAGTLGFGDLASLASNDSLFAATAVEKLEQLQAELRPLSERYDVVVANPPYMGSKNMNKWLGEWVKENYPDVKGDLFSCFMVRNSKMGSDHAQMGFMTPYVWMFISTYEKLRKFVIEKNTITSLIQLEYSGFAGATVPICTFTLQKGYVEGYKGGYIRLSDFVGADQQAPRALEALANPDCGWLFARSSRSFDSIPGTPIAYWLSEKFIQAFTWPSIGSTIDSSTGMKTGDNDQFLRHWWEISNSAFNSESASLEESISSLAKWFPYNKGGDFRKWYGNNDEVINWRNNGEDIKTPPEKGVRHFQLIKDKWMFATHVTWTKICSSDTSFRLKERGHLFDMAGASLIPATRNEALAVLAFCNSSVAKLLLRVLAPTLNYQSGDIANLPFAKNGNDCCIVELAEDSVRLSKKDWDSYEESWDFARHPLV